MIKLNVIYNRDLRKVMHELRAFIEIGSVVFIAFDNEVIAIGYSKANAKILGDSPD
jgi:hypothetical protein